MRLVRILLAALVAVVVTAPAASAAPDRELGDLLGALWETVLETPTPTNPLGGGDPCVDLDGVVAPFQSGSNPLTCTVDRKSTRLNSSHANTSYAVFCLKNKNNHH